MCSSSEDKNVCIELLKEARDTLGDYMFTSDGMYNNWDVVNCCDKIDRFFKEVIKK